MILPNQLTVLRIILTPIFFGLFITDEPVLKQISVVVFVIAAITDWYDGWLARKFNYITEWGKFLDPLADKILTATAFLAFVFIGILPLWMVFLIILRDLVVTGIRIIADYKKVSFVTSLSAKWKTFLQMIFLYYLLFIQALQTMNFVYEGNEKIFSYLMDERAIYYAMLFITLFTVYTGVMYIYKNKRIIRQLL